MKLRRKKYLTQQQTFLELLDGGQVLDANVLEKVRDFKYSQWKLFGGHLALDEPPKYKAAEFDPDIQNAVNLCIGYESLDDFDAHLKALEAGRPPEQPGMQCGVFTLFDPSQAPDGKHTALLWQVAPYDLKDGGPVHWENIKEEYLETCIARWRHYAPNLDGKNILGKATYTPYDIARSVVNMKEGDFNCGAMIRSQILENRPVPELSNYKTPVEGLYLHRQINAPRRSSYRGTGLQHGARDPLRTRGWTLGGTPRTP